MWQMCLVEVPGTRATAHACTAHAVLDDGDSGRAARVFERSVPGQRVEVEVKLESICVDRMPVPGEKGFCQGVGVFGPGVLGVREQEREVCVSVSEPETSKVNESDDF